jgi:GTP cyclohydrolase II
MSKTAWQQVDLAPWRMYTLKPKNIFEGAGLAGVIGDINKMTSDSDGPLIRLHSQCTYGEIFDSNDCDCGSQLEAARNNILEEGAGILFYLYQEGRGAGLAVKTKAYVLRDTEGLNTAQAYERLGVPFDQRQYGHCAKFLQEHGIRKIRLMSNNPKKIEALEIEGIEVLRIPHWYGMTERNRAYLGLKMRMGHIPPVKT